MEESNSRSNENKNWRLRVAYDAYRSRTNTSMRELAKVAGVGSASNLQQLLAGRRPLGIASALKLSQALQVPISDILDEDKVQLVIDCYGAISANTIEKAGDSYRIFVYELSQVQEALKHNEEPTENVVFGNYKKNRSIVGVTVSGCEMRPLLERNDIVVIDLEEKPKPRDIVLAVVEGQKDPVLRQYAVVDFDKFGNEIFELRPLDDAFPCFSSSRFGIKILGVALEKRAHLL